MQAGEAMIWREQILRQQRQGVFHRRDVLVPARRALVDIYHAGDLYGFRRPTATNDEGWVEVDLAPGAYHLVCDGTMHSFVVGDGEAEVCKPAKAKR